MKKLLSKPTLLITCIALLLIVGIGTTVAFIITSTGPVTNTFTPTDVSCTVYTDNGTTDVAGAIQDTATLTDVQIKNTGDTDAYIRVALVINWANGSRVWAQAPASSDYTLTFKDNNNWIEGSDGFYYYQNPVAPGALSDILLKEVTANQQNAPKGPDGTQYYFSIEIVASAIQANPATTAQNSWGVTIENGKIVSK